MKKKRLYEKPSTEVVELKQKSALLAGSPVTQSASFEDYKGGDFSWDD